MSWLLFTTSAIFNVTIGFDKRFSISVIAAFISTLMMVGIVTFPVEIKYFGKKLTILRNLTAFVFSFIVALIIGKVMG